MAKTPEEIIRDDIRALTAYHVPDSSGMVKLDAMENPYGLPPALRARIARLVEDASLNRYPDPGAGQLKARLRVSFAVPEAAELLLGNGSDEILQMLVLAAARPGAVVLGVEPSFTMFRMISAFAGVRYVGVELRDDFGLDVGRLLAGIEQHRPGLIFLAYPNNPTGNLFDAAGIERIIAAAPGMVLIDEAYHAFADLSFMARVPQQTNLLVMRTLSKLGLAGIRLGVLAGRGEWIAQLDKLRLPYNVNTLTQVVACEVLQHEAVLTEQAAAIKLERGRLLRGLQEVPGLTAYPSDANFLLFRIGNAERVFDGLKQRGVLIKSLHGSHRLLANCLRVTVGTPQENDAFLAALTRTLNA
ncbi:MAG: histidinol-phosphate transaminase [Betaproteobacteria bacterium]|nr:histidinol-phosphate transaminase [Betaproteobacteria bacterium]MDH3435579.1 histidinol-phosphate transaminase [Betaproteobacteria bacterium]